MGKLNLDCSSIKWRVPTQVIHHGQLVNLGKWTHTQFNSQRLVQHGSWCLPPFVDLSPLTTTVTKNKWTVEATGRAHSTCIRGQLTLRKSVCPKCDTAVYHSWREDMDGLPCSWRVLKVGREGECRCVERSESNWMREVADGHRKALWLGLGWRVGSVGARRRTRTHRVEWNWETAWVWFYTKNWAGRLTTGPLKV